MPKSKLCQLTWLDLAVLTLFLFALPIYRSTLAFLDPSLGFAGESLPSDWANYLGLIEQGLALSVAVFYLHWRRFDFSVWSFKVTGRAFLTAGLLFLLLAGLNDLYYLLFSPENREYYLAAPLAVSKIWLKLSEPLTLSTVLYALFNGVYEEVYFVGMCLATRQNHRRLVWLLSLVVRFSFHTYQGLFSAFSIALILGIFYYVWYEILAKRNLFPIFLSHALADIWGLGLLYYFF